MSGSYKINEAQRQEIVDRYQAGEPCKTIARKYGINRSYVSLLARKAGHVVMRGSDHGSRLHRMALKAKG